MGTGDRKVLVGKIVFGFRFSPPESCWFTLALNIFGAYVTFRAGESRSPEWFAAGVTLLKARLGAYESRLSPARRPPSAVTGIDRTPIPAPIPVKCNQLHSSITHGQPTEPPFLLSIFRSLFRLSSPYPSASSAPGIWNRLGCGNKLPELDGQV